MQNAVFLLELLELVLEIEIVLLILAKAEHLPFELIDEHLLLVGLNVEWTVVLT